MQKQKSFDKQTTKGKLYLVPTPIGNLEDMSIRCLNILKEATVIASEDTRNTQKLLNHFEITTPQISLHEHNYKERIPQLITRLPKLAMQVCLQLVILVMNWLQHVLKKNWQ